MRIHSLDGLRGLLSSLIILHHVDLGLGLNPLIYTFQNYSQYAVDLFFVLSGFVIAKKYLFSEYSPIDFMKKRFIRLYPLHLFFALAYFILEAIAYHLLPDLVNFQPLGQRLSHLLDSILLTNSIPIFEAGAGANPISWSISAQFVVYFIFCFFLLKKRKLHYPLILSVILILGLYSSLLYGFEATGSGFGRALFGFFLPIIGVISNKRYLLIIQLILLLIMFNFEQFIFQGFLPIMVFLLIKLTEHSKHVILNNKVLNFLGKISYSLYLSHLIIVKLLNNFLLNYFNPLMTFTILLITCIIIGWLVYEYIEKNSIKLARLVLSNN